jgi:nucleoside-diphosphate-sugar epimerase
MQPRRILLTGASGFVAGHLVPRLRAAFPAAALTLCGVGGEALDIADRDAVFELVRRVRPEACIHLAAISAIGEARRDPERAWRVNLMGTLALAEALREVVPDCVMVFASSAEVYGGTFRSGVALDEGAVLAPMNTYAATKAAADLALGAMAGEGLRVVRVRPFNHTGAGQSEGFVVPAFAAQIARIGAGGQGAELMVGNLDACRDFLDVRDVCAAYVACIERAEALAPGAVLNLASGVARRIGDVLDDLLRISGVRVAVTRDPARLRPSDIPMAWGDAGLARRVLGWAPRIAWETTLGDVLADWR